MHILTHPYELITIMLTVLQTRTCPTCSLRQSQLKFFQLKGSKVIGITPNGWNLALSGRGKTCWQWVRGRVIRISSIHSQGPGVCSSVGPLCKRASFGSTQKAPRCVSSQQHEVTSAEDSEPLSMHLFLSIQTQRNSVASVSPTNCCADLCKLRY